MKRKKTIERKNFKKYVSVRTTIRTILVSKKKIMVRASFNPYASKENQNKIKPDSD